MNETTIVVVGNLTADPELRFLESGAAMSKFQIASTPRFFDKASGRAIRTVLHEGGVHG